MGMVACFVSLCFSLGEVRGEETGRRVLADLEYARVGELALFLDLTLPAPAELRTDRSKPPLVLYIHGGGWRAGTRKGGVPDYLVEQGFAVASVDYRLSSTAVHPAQIHDCKAALRWLRARADEYGYDPERVAAMGTSAGAHLAVLLGTTGGMAALEGEVGEHSEESTVVQAIVDFYGPIDFLLRSKDQPEQTEQEGGKVYQLLGGSVREKADLARQASGVYHVTADDPPLLIVHGTADRTVLLNQSERLRDVYRAAGLKAEFHLVEGGGHGGEAFMQLGVRQWVIDFLKREL